MGAKMQRGAYSRAPGLRRWPDPSHDDDGVAPNGRPGGAEARTGESVGLQRRNALSTSGLFGDRTPTKSNRFPICNGLCGGRTREQ